MTDVYTFRNYSDILTACKVFPFILKCLVKCEYQISQTEMVKFHSVTNYWNVVSWQKQPARRNSFFLSIAVSRCGVGLELGAGRVAHTRITNSRVLGCGKLLDLVLHGVSSARLMGSMSDTICAASRESYAIR